jgi:Fe-S cluster biogenesis protein NfuA
MSDAVRPVADLLVAQFSRMVARDGGALSLLGIDSGVIRVGYRAGADPTCEGGTCILPHLELQDLMNETVARRDPGLKVVVQPVS